MFVLLISFPSFGSTSFYKLMRYSRRTLYIAHLLLQVCTKYIFDTVIGYLYFFANLVIERKRYPKRYVNSYKFYSHEKKKRYYRGMYYTSIIGGAADRNKELWHKIASNYRIVESLESTHLMGGYMITLSAAAVFKRINTSGRKIPNIDDNVFGRSAKGMD